jgi:hypothetical protein
MRFAGDDAINLRFGSMGATGCEQKNGCSEGQRARNIP